MKGVPESEKLLKSLRFKIAFDLQNYLNEKNINIFTTGGRRGVISIPRVCAAAAISCRFAFLMMWIFAFVLDFKDLRKCELQGD